MEKVTVTNKDIQALNEFLENREVDYVLTGTAALFYHGMLPEDTEVHDIDILGAKFSLNRVKDHEFFAKVVNQLSDMFPDV